MSFKHRVPVFAVVATMAALVPTFALGMGGAGGGGGIGCSNLPEYDRALGTLQGLSTCDMTVEEARRIVGVQGRSAVSDAPAPYRHRRHRTQAPQE